MVSAPARYHVAADACAIMAATYVTPMATAWGLIASCSSWKSANVPLPMATERNGSVMSAVSTEADVRVLLT